MHQIIGLAALDRALSTPFAPALQHLLRQRREQLAEYDDDALFNFLVVMPGDTLPAIEQVIGFSSLSGFEYVADHGGWFEAPFVLSDDGTGVILIVQDHEGVPADLLATMRTHAAAPDQGDHTVTQ